MKWTDRFYTVGAKMFYYAFISLIAVATMVSFISYTHANQTLEDEVTKASELSVYQAAGKLDLFLDVYQSIHRQILLNETIRTNGELLKTTNFGEKVKYGEPITNILTIYKNSNKNILGVRLIEKSLVSNHNNMKIPYAMISSTPTNFLGMSDWQYKWCNRIIKADGAPVWIPTNSDGFFIHPSPHKTASFSMGALLRNMKDRNREYIMLIEIDASAFSSILEGLVYNDQSELDLNDVQANPIWQIRVPESQTEYSKIVTVSKSMNNAPWTLTERIPIDPLLASINASTRNTFLLMLLLSLAVSFLISTFAGRSISRRIKQLSIGAQTFANSRANLTGLQVADIELDQRDEIGQLGGAIHVLSDLMEHIRVTSAQLQTLLDQTDQGFLSIGNSLAVHPTYSAACQRWLTSPGETLSGVPVSMLLFPRNEQDSAREQLEQMMSDVFETSIPMQRQLMCELLSQELVINDRTIQMSCKMIDNETMLIILTDLTESVTLQSKILQERNTLNMIVQLLTNEQEFRALMHDFRTFSSTTIPYWLDVTENHTWLEECYRHIHTFKGSFGQYGMMIAATYAHEFETMWEQLHENESELLAFIRSTNWLGWIQEEMSMLDRMIGSRLKRSRETISFEKQQVFKFEQQIRKLLDQAVTPAFESAWREMHYQPLKQLLSSYVIFTQQLALRMQKPLEAIEIKGGDQLVDPMIWHRFVKSLIHVFRNMVDHGLETMEERIEADKSETGRISVEIKQIHQSESTNRLIICIGDDGRGISVERVREKAVAANLISKSAADERSVTELYELIFMDGFSTNDQADAISGRGIGLAAVKSEVERMGGTISVSSIVGEGTMFEFSFVI